MQFEIAQLAMMWIDRGMAWPEDQDKGEAALIDVRFGPVSWLSVDFDHA